MNDLKRASEKVIQTCLNLENKENLLILCDESTQEIAEELYETRASNTILVKTGSNIEDALKKVSSLIKKEDALIVLTKSNSFSLSEIKKATKRGVRAAIIPEATRKSFKKAIDIDYSKLQKQADALEKKMKKAKKIKVISSNGTDFEFSNNFEEVKNDGLGLITKKGGYGFLPAGEIYSPVFEKTSKGVIVIDSMFGLCKPRTKLLVKKGLVQEVEGDEEFRAKLLKNKKRKKINSFGIGLNPKATVSKHIIEDNKIKGTCHIVLGQCSNFSDKNLQQSWSALIIAPTIFFDDEKVMSEGEILI